MRRFVLAGLLLAAGACGSAPVDLGTTTGDPQNLYGEWKQVDATTGRVKTRITAREDGSFVVVEVGDTNKTYAGTFAVSGQTITFNMVKSGGETQSYTGYFHVNAGMLAFGEGVVLAASTGQGIPTAWKGLEVEEDRDASGRVTRWKRETSDVTVRADGTISLDVVKTRGTPMATPERSAREGTWREVAPGQVSVTWTGQTRPFVMRLIDNVALASDESIFTR